MSTRESLKEEPILDDELVQQNLELMGSKFPSELVDEWRENIVPFIMDIINNSESMDDKTISDRAHKAAGSALQIGANQLGQALRYISQTIRSGNRDSVSGVIQDLKGYYDSFEEEVKKNS